MKHLKKSDYSVSDWSGGRTTEIAIAPDGAKYADREFLWRVSSATVELEKSEFTALPDYDRLIAPLSGTMTLTHNGGAPVKLEPIMVHAFSGSDMTRSEGKCTDFNLMLRKGRCEGSMAPASLEKGGSLTTEPDTDTTLFYAVSGVLEAVYEGGTVLLKAGEALLTEKRDGAVHLRAKEGTVLMKAEIKYL